MSRAPRHRRRRCPGMVNRPSRRDLRGHGHIHDPQASIRRHPPAESYESIRHDPQTLMPYQPGRPMGTRVPTCNALGTSPLLLFALLVAAATACGRRYDYARMEFTFVNGNGVDARPTETVTVGDSPSLSFSGLEPGAPVEVFLNDDAGKEWSYARLYADRKGRVEPTLFWYHTGVIGTSSRQIAFRPDPAFETFDEAETYFRVHGLTLTVRDLRRRMLAQRPFRIAPRVAPMVYPSDARGVLMNAMELPKDDVYVSGRNFPAGSVVHLYVVPNQYVWHAGDTLRDVTGPGGGPAVETVRLRADQTGFTAQVWRRGQGRPGSYDIVARIGPDVGRPVLQPRDVLGYNDDTGIILFLIINGNIVIETAGRMRAAPAKFEFSDSFEKGEDVYGAVDPSDVPTSHPGGNYAAYYVVEHQPASYWDGPAPA